MLTSSKNMNSAVKSLALILALVFAVACCLTACADKQARADIEALKAESATKEELNAVKTTADAAVTDKKLADTLANYLKKSDLATEVAPLLTDYAKTADVDTFVKGLLANYLTKEEAGATYAKKTDLEAYVKSADYALDKTAMEGLIAACVKKADVNTFIADYISSTAGKEVVIATLGDTYLNTEDWVETTAAIIEGYTYIFNVVTEVTDALYTPANWTALQNILKDNESLLVACGVEPMANGDYDLSVDAGVVAVVTTLRAYDLDGFQAIVSLVEAIDAVPNSVSDAEAIYAKLDALNATIQAKTVKKVTSDDGEAIEELAEDINTFFANYAKAALAADDLFVGFEAAPVATTKCFPACHITTNNDIWDYADDDLTVIDFAFEAAITEYQRLMGLADDINDMIAALVLEQGQKTDKLTDAAVVLVEKLCIDTDQTGDADGGFVNIFLNNTNNVTITTPIDAYEALQNYYFLYGKTNFGGKKNAAMITLNEYAAAISAANPAFAGSEMNDELASALEKANTAIMAIDYSSFKVAGAAETKLNETVAAGKLLLDEILNKYYFVDLKVNVLKAAAEKANDPATAASVKNYIVKQIVELEKIVPATTAAEGKQIVTGDNFNLENGAAIKDCTTLVYPYYVAIQELNALNALMNAEVALKEAIIDGVAEVNAYVDTVKAMVGTTEYKAVNVADTIKSNIDTVATAEIVKVNAIDVYDTFAEGYVAIEGLDAAKVNTALAQVAPAVLAAEKAIYNVYAGATLNDAKQDAQNYVYAVLNANKAQAAYADVYTLALKAIKDINKLAIGEVAGETIGDYVTAVNAKIGDLTTSTTEGVASIANIKAAFNTAVTTAEGVLLYD